MSCSDLQARRAIRRGMALKPIRLGVALLGLTALAACAGGHPSGPLALTPTEQFPLQVTSHPEQIALGPHPAGLSPNQKAALSEFVSRWREDGGGTVVVRAPGGPGGVMGGRMAAETAAFVQHLGVPPERVELAGYAAGPAPGAPVLASYEKFEAIGPNCSGGWGDATSTGTNRTFQHFGCAVTANFAAQLANPRDLLAPAVTTPSDDTRREVVLGKYRRGEVTSSPKDDQANGKVSDSTQ